jgi:DNA-binding Lrp family transcriptional regulator
MNNGQIAMPARLLAERLDVSPSTAARALLQLEAAGLIETIKVGSFRRKDRMASEYRLTFHRCDASGAPPSRAFMEQGPAHSVKNSSSGPMDGTVAP